MRDNEYICALKEIKNKIDNKELDEAVQELNKLYAVKPVRLLWFLLKAEVIYKMTGDINRVRNILNNKAWILYNYSGVEEYLKLNINVAQIIGDDIDEKRFTYHLNKVTDSKNNCEYVEIEKYYEIFLKNYKDEAAIEKITEDCYIKQDYVFQVIMSKLCPQKNLVRQWILKSNNMGYLQEKLDSENEDCFIIIEDDDDNALRIDVISNALTILGKDVYIITKPEVIEVDSNIDISMTTDISISNMEMYNNIKLVRPVKLILNNTSIGDNRDFIIDYINKNYSSSELSTIISSGLIMDELSERNLMKKQFQRLYDFQSDYLNSNLTFGWSGDYLSYISDIYGFNVEEKINSKSECDFSIVIPARNSAETLRYTIQSCLDINYAGNYEIVISDNSNDDNGEVYDLVCELNDTRIKYYKTPRDLQLSKSFEFAYLQAKGEFIFSIGSDDGILPWSLDVIKNIIDRYPNEEIIKWQRGFYAWPGFSDTQENQFVIPKQYTKNDFGIKYTSSAEFLAEILSKPGNMYSLPMLYINSGFKRSYLKTLINKTGRLWDGICQDIYMGVVNISINKDILTIDYPLTIAGMSKQSIGKLSNSAHKKVDDANKETKKNKSQNNIGGFSMSSIERLMPEVRSDVSSLYNSILRVIARGILPQEYLTNVLEWKKMFVNCIELMNKEDVMYDKKIHSIRYTATKHGEEFLKWFDDTIYPILIKPEDDDNIDSEVSKKTKYKTGYNKEGGLVLDASEYNVKNIYDAVKLFCKLTDL